jgi:hypothetical protein
MFTAVKYRDPIFKTCFGLVFGCSNYPPAGRADERISKRRESRSKSY